VRKVCAQLLFGYHFTSDLRGTVLAERAAVKAHLVRLLCFGISSPVAMLCVLVACASRVPNSLAESTLANARRLTGGGHPFWWAGFVYLGDPGDR
jgi:hypothetical protein